MSEPRLELLEQYEGKILYRARSWKSPARFYLVTFDVATGAYTCDCEGFTHWYHCHHIPGWSYQELEGAVADHLRAKRVRTDTKPVPRDGGAAVIAPAPPLYRDVIENWDEAFAVCKQLVIHDPTYARAVAKADGNVMAARLWRIRHGIRVIPPPGMELVEALHAAPPTSTINRYGRLIRADPAMAKYLPDLDADEQARRQEGVKAVMVAAKAGRQQQAFEVGA